MSANTEVPAKVVKKQLTRDQKAEIIAERASGVTLEHLASTFNVSASTIHRVLAKWAAEKSTERTPGSGRPPSTTKKDDAYIIRCIKMNRFVDIEDIVKGLRSAGVAVSRWTVSRRKPFLLRFRQKMTVC